MKKIVISVFFVLLYFVYFSHVEAAGTVNLSASSNTVNVGDNFTINVNLSGASVATLTTRLSIDEEKVQYVSGPSNSNYSNGRVIYTWTDPTGGASPLTAGNIATFTFKAISAGNANFGVSGEFFTPDETSVEPVFSGVTVNVNDSNNMDNPNENNGQTENQQGQQNDGQDENIVGGQTNNQDVENNVTNEGTNTDENNPNINQQDSRSSNNNLRTLQLNVEGISPRFNSRTTQYYLTITEDVNNIEVIAEPEDTKASVQVIGNTNIPLGSSQIRIIVTAENGNRKEYYISVSKTNDIELANANLENLAIEDVTLVPEFSPDITDYTAEVFGDIDSLNILAVPQKENAQVLIEGNENLQYGENLISVIVNAEDGISSKVYNITVVKTEGILSDTNEDTELQNTENVDNAVENNVKMQRIIIVVFVIALAICLIIWAVWRKRKNQQ